MKKLVLPVLLQLLLMTAPKAQFTGAVVVGPHGASVTPHFLMQPDTTKRAASKRAGLHIGFIANAPLTNKLYLQAGIIYSAKGSKQTQYFDTANVDLSKQSSALTTNTELQVNYIDLPLNLVYKLPLKGKTKFVIGAGPQASLFYNGKILFNTYSIYQAHRDSSFRYEYKEINEEDLPVGKKEGQFRTLHFAVNGFAGFEFGRVFINAAYSKSITPFYTNGNERFKHQTIGATLGIYLGKPQLDAPVVKDRDKDGVPDGDDACPDAAGSALTAGCPDRDGDGVADKSDSCPDNAGTVANRGCPVIDKDNDGVRDDDDRCPDVAGLGKYGGCPVPDSDGDGINDEEDRCPTVAGLVKDGGCPAHDNDKDGVNDDEDACPTVAGSVANKGCPAVDKALEEKVAFAARQIQFEFQKAVLTPASYKVLNDVVAILKANTALKISIEGHTTGTFDEGANLKLSQQRAQKVKAYLTSKGIAAERISATGYGSSRPLNNSNDPAEKAKNRRVEIKLLP